MNVMNKVNFVTEFILIIWFGVLIVFTAAQAKPPDHVEDFQSLVTEIQKVENVVLFEELLHKIRPKDISEMRKSNIKKKEWQDKLDEFKQNKIDHEVFYDYLNKEFEDLERRFNVVKKIVDATSAGHEIYKKGLFKTLAQNLKDKLAKVKQDEEEERRKIQEEKDRKAKEAQQNVTSTTPSTTTKATAPPQPTTKAPDNATAPASVPQPTPKPPDNATAPASPPQPQQNTTTTTTTSTTTTTTATSVPQATQQAQTTQVPSQEKTVENCFVRLLDWIKKLAEFKFSILRAKLDFLKKKFSSFKK